MFSAVQEVVQSHNGPLSNGQSLLRLFTTSAAHVEQGKAFPLAPRATTSSQTPRVPTVNLVSGAVCHAARHSPACRPHLTSTLGSFSMIFLKICALSLCSQSLYVARRFLESGSARTLALRDTVSGPACRVASWEGELGNVRSESDPIKRKRLCFNSERRLGLKHVNHLKGVAKWVY